MENINRQLKYPDFQDIQTFTTLELKQLIGGKQYFLCK